MPSWGRILSGAVSGGILGGMALSLWSLVFLDDPDQTWKDIVYALCFFQIPFGALAGAVAGVATVSMKSHFRKTAGCVCLVGGGLLAVLWFCFIALTPGALTTPVVPHLLWLAVYPGLGSPMVWALGEIICGLVLLRGH